MALEVTRGGHLAAPMASTLHGHLKEPLSYGPVEIIGIYILLGTTLWASLERNDYINLLGKNFQQPFGHV